MYSLRHSTHTNTIYNLQKYKYNGKIQIHKFPKNTYQPDELGKPRIKRDHSPKILKNVVKFPNSKYTCTGLANTRHHHKREL